VPQQESPAALRSERLPQPGPDSISLVPLLRRISASVPKIPSVLSLWPIRENRQMRPSNAVRTVCDAEAIDTSHLGFRPIQKIATIHTSFRVHSGNVPSVQKMTLGAIGLIRFDTILCGIMFISGSSP